MKSISLFLCLTCFFSAFGQQNYCGTEMPQHMVAWLDSYMDKGTPANKQTDAVSLKYIPLKIHLAGTDEGTGFVRLQFLLDGLCRLKEQYEHAGFYLYIYEGIDFISSTQLYNHEGGYEQVISSSLDPNGLNIYYVNSANGNCGYYSGWGDFVAIANGCAGPANSTVAHELGHYFDLPHTFSGWDGQDTSRAPRATDERVNGSNCNTAGDRFCDTPADYISTRWSCPYSGSKLDYNGDPYNVDGTLFMSYANDACQSRFSPEQIDVMHAYMDDVHGDLLSLPVPLNMDSIGEAQSIYPSHGSIDIPANFAQLKWRKVPGATYYHVQASRFATIINVDTIIQDTSLILTDLDYPYNYKWRVRPFNEGYTCAGYNAYSVFRTKEATSIIPSYIVTEVSCPGETDGSISVGVSGGTQPYSFDWSTGDNGQIIANLNPGNYVLTISEAGQDSLIISFDIGEPETLNTEIEQWGNVLSATVTGGSPPFTYQWSNGSNVAQNSVIDAGNYSVRVTDSHGCSVIKSFFFTDITSLDIANTHIYPNPVTNGELLVVEVFAKEVFNGRITMLDNTGRTVFAFDRSFNSGLNKEVFSLSSLSNGIYLLRITNDEGVNFSRKVVVM